MRWWRCLDSASSAVLASTTSTLLGRCLKVLVTRFPDWLMVFPMLPGDLLIFFTAEMRV